MASALELTSESCAWTAKDQARGHTTEIAMPVAHNILPTRTHLNEASRAALPCRPCMYASTRASCQPTMNGPIMTAATTNTLVKCTRANSAMLIIRHVKYSRLKSLRMPCIGKQCVRGELKGNRNMTKGQSRAQPQKRWCRARAQSRLRLS